MWSHAKCGGQAVVGPGKVLHVGRGRCGEQARCRGRGRCGGGEQARCMG